MRDTKGMDMDMSDLVSLSTYEAGMLQTRAHRSLQKYSDHILDSYGITKQQWMVIGMVADADGERISITELAEIFDTTDRAMAETVEYLAARTILRQHEADAETGSITASITDTFVPTLSHIEFTFRKSLRKTIYATVSPADLRTYLKVLYKLSQVAS